MILYGPFQTNLSARIDGCAFVVFWLHVFVHMNESTSTCMDGWFGWLDGWLGLAGWYAGSQASWLAGGLVDCIVCAYAFAHVCLVWLYVCVLASRCVRAGVCVCVCGVCVCLFVCLCGVHACMHASRPQNRTRASWPACASVRNSSDSMPGRCRKRALKAAEYSRILLFCALRSL